MMRPEMQVHGFFTALQHTETTEVRVVPELLLSDEAIEFRDQIVAKVLQLTLELPAGSRRAGTKAALRARIWRTQFRRPVAR
jgi:hypothetical protein